MVRVILYIAKMSETTESLVNVNMHSVNDIESNGELNTKMDETLAQLRELTNILHQERQVNSDNSVETCLKIFAFIVVLVLLAPLTVADLYYAYTDDSCVHQPAGNLNVNLFTYLAVDGIIGGIGVVVFSLMVCSLGTNNVATVLKGCCMVSIYVLCGLFTLAWTIVGSIIFWKLIDNEECSKGVYNYVFALLIIRYVSVLVNLCNNSNTKKE